METSIVYAGSILITLLSLLRFIAAVWLFAAPLTPRPNASRRVACAVAALLALYLGLLLVFVAPTGWHEELRYALGELATFSLLLAGLTWATLHIYDTNLWTAIFCSSAGYAIENFVSGFVELVQDLYLTEHEVVGRYSSPIHYVAMAVGTLVVYSLVYVLITRRLIKQGSRQVDDPLMLFMTVAVIAVIIGFDLLIKGMVSQGIDTRAMVMLRIFHGVTCIFTLGAGLQLLVARRIEAERDTAWQVLAERERQYETSRENVEAINARVHDIRHAIGRLANDAQVDRDVLASIVREVDVFGKSLRTGNAAVDTVLAKKGLVCNREGITLSCVADGSLLAFLAPGDAYALFSTLLNEAVARTMTLPAGRSVSLTIRETLGSVAVHLECPQAEDSSAASEARMAPLQALCDRYDATLATMDADGTWHANVLFPQSDEAGLG